MPEQRGPCSWAAEARAVAPVAASTQAAADSAMPMRAASLTARVKRPAWLLGTDLPGGTTNWTCGAGRSVAVTGLPRMMRGAGERVAPALPEPLWVQAVRVPARGGRRGQGGG